MDGMLWAAVASHNHIARVAANVGTADVAAQGVDLL